LRLLQNQNKFEASSRVFQRSGWLRLAFLVFLFVFHVGFITSSHAESEEGSAKLIEYLAQEKTNLTVANNELNQFFPPADATEVAARLKQNETLLAVNEAKMANLNSFLNNQRKQQQILAQQLEKLQESTLDKSEQMLAQEQISKINTLNEVNTKTIELITENVELSRHYQQKLIIAQQEMNVWKAKFTEQKRLDSIQAQINGLNETRDNLYESNIELQQKKKMDANFNSIFQEEAKLILNNHHIILVQHRITELELQKRLIQAEYSQLQNHDVKTIESSITVYRQGLEQLSSVENSLKQMGELVKSEPALTEDVHLKGLFVQLQQTITSHLQEIAVQQHSLKKQLEVKESELIKQMGVRQSLADYNLTGIPAILHQFINMPTQLYNYLKVLALKVRDNYVWQDRWPAAESWLSVGLILLSAFGLRRLLRVTEDKERSRLSAHLYDGLLLILYRNIPYLALLSGLVVTFYINHVPLANYQLLLNLMFLWLLFRNLILIARLTLLERISDASGNDVRLYYQFKWLLLSGEWSTILMVFSHQLPLSILLQDIFNRVFMVFLLAISVVLWRSKAVIPHLLDPFLLTKKRYVRNAVSLLIFLIPITLFTTALIGLIGYFNLAWTLSRYQVYFLLIITGYVLARGLMLDALDLISEWMISGLKNGWLWIEVVLKPLDKIFRLVLAVLGGVILFEVFGLTSEPRLMSALNELIKYPFVNISGVHITLKSTAEFLMLLFACSWAAKWTRELCYRWVYRNSRDAGIRNSLSVFTQYAVILIGGFITLRVLGLDFSGMSMILGGLAVGMGFGLRDFASNIVGGLMLLIERPVREGDLITIGEHEGRVAHIGIRSMRVSSWDNMEVLIPNAETLNKPFTNWTHQDSIVRTVIPIKVSRSDDPVIIQHLIFDVLATTPEILGDPPPQVFLKQIDDALIEFEARYFINVELYTRFEIRSKVLFAITAQFKAAGVKAPIPPLSIEIKEGERDHVVHNAHSEE
jgi:potassium efflux system protein